MKQIVEIKDIWLKYRSCMIFQMSLKRKEVASAKDKGLKRSNSYKILWS